VKNRFRNLPFKCNLQRYNSAAATAERRELSHRREVEAAAADAAQAVQAVSAAAAADLAVGAGTR
jgi:hypothetical protein